MMRKKKSSLKKSLQNYFIAVGFKLWKLWLKHLSLESLGFYGEKLGMIAFYILRPARRMAMYNLHLAFGSKKSEEEIKQICRDNFKNIGRDMMEVSRCLDYEQSYFKELVSLEGREYLDQALKQGKGVIALSGHLGNFPLMCARLANEGYPLSVVVRDSKNPEIVEFMNSFRAAAGVGSIPFKPKMTCVAQCLKALKENRIILLQIDINAPETEAWVDFFGYLVPTYTGPVVLSLRTDSPIVPMFICRNAHGHNIIIHPPFDMKIKEDREQDILSNTARLTKMIEATICEYPDQWWWALRRFKRAKDAHTGERIFPKHP